MIDAKQAVQIAKEKAVELLGAGSARLEEIELGAYKDREAWSITLSLPRDLQRLDPIARIGTEPWEYKRFLIDYRTGELLAMKLREVASQ
jgi:hypothetical protein